VEQELKRASIEKRLVTRTPEGIDVQPLYRREDLASSAMTAGTDASSCLCAVRRLGAPSGRWWACSEPAEYEFSPLPALASALARSKRNAQADLPDVSVAADPLGWLVSQGSLPMPLERCFDDLAGGVREAERAGSPVQTVGVGAHLWHESGAHAVQELAFALATGAEYWRALLDRALTPAQIATRTRLSLAVGVDFFMEIAKLRAARVLWAKLAGAFGAEAVEQKVFLVARTAAWDKTLYDLHVNLLRITTQALSAVVGGADGVDIRSFDEVTGGPTESGKRLSRNLHDILAEEFSFANQVDPAGGAWHVEALTAQLARRAWALFQEVEKMGGMAKAVLAGYPQQLVTRTAEDKQASIDTRRRPILGTTVQPNLRDEPKAASEPAASAGARHRSVPKSIKSFSALLAAAGKRTTLPTLRIAWTQKRDPGPTAVALQPSRAAEGFEAVRRAGDSFFARTGKRARVFLARMGPSKQHQPRADFSTGFFAVGGFELDGKKSFATAEEAAVAALASGAVIAVLCSTDATYPELAPVFARRVKAAKPALPVILAGHPGEHEREYRTAGFDEFIHLRSNVRTTLTQLQRLAGVIA
jgi:methylmalonyl-CoA mutase